MTTPVGDRDDLRTGLVGALSQYLNVSDDSREIVGLRQDIVAVLRFLGLNTPSVHDAAHLFWNMYQPRMMALSNADDEPGWVPNLTAEDIERRVHRLMYPPAPPASAHLDRLLMDCLDWVYNKFRVPHEPDGDNSENLLDLVIDLHIAAARAFKLNQVEGNQMSEEWVSRLQAIEGTVRRIRAIASPSGIRTYRNPSFVVSVDAIWGMTQLELSRVSRADGSYADAIHYLDQASTSYIWALDEIEYEPSDTGPVGRYGSSHWANTLNWEEEHVKNQEYLARRDLKNRLAPLQVSLEEASSLFNLIKQSAPNDVNWRQITDDCGGLALLSELELEVFSGVEGGDVIEDEETHLSLSWSEFWHSARAWTSAQMSPTDLVKFYQKNKETEAETRLQNYFFGSAWKYLPPRAKRRLINADSLLNSTQRVAPEALLNELRIATEELCYLVVWQQLDNSRTPPLEFIREKLKLDEQPGHSDLGISDYIRICRSRWYREFLNQQNLDRDDVKFLTGQLPRDMSQLRSERNLAEHKTGASAAADSPQSFYRGFLGIGQPGILPQIARIGRKL